MYRQIDPHTGDKLGRARGRYATFADHLARLRAAEPHATAERLIELEREAAQATRQPAAYTDVTVSFSKSISVVLHASIRENERRARQAGDQQVAAYWARQEKAFQEILHWANRAALEYLQAWAGVTRTGYHGTRIDGRDPGRFEAAGLIVTSWLQGTSRDGDPQDHIHNQIARITRTTRDGKWRAHDTASLRAVLGALQAIAATTVECELTREFGVEWIPRADGRGNEIRSITRAQMDAYSTRAVQVREKERELARAWERRRGRAPTSRELLHIANDATLQSREGKDAAPVDCDALAARWDATLGGELAGIAPAVSNARGPGVHGHEHHGGHAPTGPPTREAQARALAKALTLVSDKHHPAARRHPTRPDPARLADRGRRGLHDPHHPPGRDRRVRGPQRLQAGASRGLGAARRSRGRRRHDSGLLRLPCLSPSRGIPCTNPCTNLVAGLRVPTSDVRGLRTPPARSSCHRPPTHRGVGQAPRRHFAHWGLLPYQSVGIPGRVAILPL